MLDGRLVSASFTLCVQQGRVVRMDRYVLPPEVLLHTSQGGVCAMPIESMFTKDSAGNLYLPHRVNPVTGMYKGRVVIDIVAEKKRADRRQKRREKALRESGQDTGQKEKETAT